MKRLIFFSIAFCFTFTPVSANEIQVWICEAGQNFGQAVARAYIATEFGTVAMGPQETAMFENLDNAVRFIQEIEAALPEPWATIRKDNNHARRIENLVTRLRGKWSGLPLHQRVGQIEDIYKSYLESLRYTYNSDRPDAVQKNPNCDSKIFETCYNFGIAKISSETAGDPNRPNFVKRYHNLANSRFSGSVESGLDLAMDPGHLPFNGHAQKACCGFGAVESWRARPNFREESPTSAYLGYEVEMKEIIRLANPSNECAQNTHHACISTDYYKSKYRWKGLDLSCFDDPRYSWLKTYVNDFVITPNEAPAWWLEQNNYESAKFTNWMLAYGATSSGATFNFGWLEAGTTTKPDDPFCSCNGEFTQTINIKPGKVSTPADPDLGIYASSRDFPGGVIYSYTSKQQKAAKFEIKILRDSETGIYIKDVAYYQDLANCILAQLEPLAVSCNCNTPTYSLSQNDPGPLAGPGSETPTNPVRTRQAGDGSDAPLNLSPKEKWLSEFQVKKFRFYERPSKSRLPFEQRIYSKDFYRHEARFIYWELTIDSPPPTEKIDFAITEVWLKADGTELYRYTRDNYFQKDWQNGIFGSGFGNQRPYNWSEGNYTVKLYIGDRLISQESFEVKKGPTVSTKQDWLNSIRLNSLHIFESGKDINEPKYNEHNTFSAAETRYINYRLGINSLPATKDFIFTIYYHYFDHYGNKIASNHSKWTFPTGSDERYYKNGYGNATPGKFFKPGAYYLEVYVEDKFIGKENFTIR